MQISIPQSSIFVKKILVITLLLLFYCPLSPYAMDETKNFSLQIPVGSLTLNTAQQMALKASPSIKEGLARIQTAQAILEQSRATYRPNISLYTNYRFQNSTNQPDWNLENRVSDSFSKKSAGIQANWLIFDGFSRQAQVLAMRHQVESSQQLFDESRRLLANSVAVAFYQAQLGVESMLIAKQNQEFNLSLEKEAHIRWQAGSIPEAEKLNFSVKTLQAEIEFFNAERDFHTLCTVLAQLLALPDTQLPENLYPIRSDKDLSTDNVPSYKEEVDQAMQNRPDLKALETSLLALKEKRREQQGHYWPKVFLHAGADYRKLTGTGKFNQREHDTFSEISLSWDLYNGGQRPARIQEIDTTIQTIRQQRLQKIILIQSEIQQSIKQASAALIIYEKQKQSLSFATRIRNHTEKAYRAGVATITRLNEAQTDLVRVAGAKAASRISYLLALQQLDAASGRIQDSFKGDSKGN